MSRSQVREGFHVPIRTYSYQWYLRAHVSYDHIICPGNTPAIIWYNVRIVTGICTRYAIWYVKILVLNVTGMEGHVCCLYQAQMKQRRLPVLPTPDAVRQPDSVRQGRAHKLSWMISRSHSYYPDKFDELTDLALLSRQLFNLYTWPCCSDNSK